MFKVFRILFPFTLTLFLLTACEETSFIGLEIQPAGDRFIVRNYVDTDISSSVVSVDPLVGSGYSETPLGIINDPVFGYSKFSFVTQLGVSSINFDFGSGAQPEELYLQLYVNSFHGDMTDPQVIRVYEMNEYIEPDSTYFNNFDPSGKIDISNPIGEYTYNPSVNDTVILIPLTDTDFQEKLVNAPDSAKASIGNFTTYMKGLYVETSLASGEGSAFSVDLNRASSEMRLYYSNAERPDTVMQYRYIIEQGAKRINISETDYSASHFAGKIDAGITGDSVFYLQGMAGIRSRLDFNNLQDWRDSLEVKNLSIISAKIVFSVEELDNTTGKYPPPNWLTAYEYRSDGTLRMIRDYQLGAEYFGGRFNDFTGEYALNITNYVQNYMKNPDLVSSLLLAVDGEGRVPGRAVLRSSDNSRGGPRLEIIYANY